MKNVTVTRNAPDGAIHGMFGLSYASFLVLPRTLLQSMPLDWQERFAQCVSEYSHHWAGVETEPPGGYRVQTIDHSGRYTRGYPIPRYDRGRTLVTPDNNRPRTASNKGDPCEAPPTES